VRWYLPLEASQYLTVFNDSCYCYKPAESRAF
jgi:hypothetical protein